MRNPYHNVCSRIPLNIFAINVTLTSHHDYHFMDKLMGNLISGSDIHRS